MDEFYQILMENLIVDQVLYTTGLGTEYKFYGWSNLNNSLRYKINNNTKYIPPQTLIECNEAVNGGVDFTRSWFRQHHSQQYTNSPCNFSVIINLINLYGV